MIYLGSINTPVLQPHPRISVFVCTCSPVCVHVRALCRMKLLPVTHVLVDMWMLTVQPVLKL